jgi:hypothetical protein
MRQVTISARYEPSLNVLLDKLEIEVQRGTIPEWGCLTVPAREVLDIVVTRRTLPPPGVQLGADQYRDATDPPL